MHHILGDPGAVSRLAGIFVGEKSKLSPTKISANRLTAPGSPRMGASKEPTNPSPECQIPFMHHDPDLDHHKETHPKLSSISLRPTSLNNQFNKQLINEKFSRFCLSFFLSFLLFLFDFNVVTKESCFLSLLVNIGD